MPAANFPGSRIEVAPHVHNARYSCPENTVDRYAFRYIAGYEECDENYHISRSSFPNLILEMVVSGIGSLRLNKVEHQVGAGFCFCGGPGIDYEFSSSSDSPLTKYFIVFGKTEGRNLAPKKFLYPGFTTQFALPEDIRKWNELIITEGISQSPDSLENVSALIAILVRKIAPDAKGKGRTERKSEALVVRALNEIESNFKTLGTLQDLADSLSVSREHLCRVFKSNDRASPYRILVRRKMEHAYAQLKMTQTPIQEIANDLGFTDSFHFSRAFKKRYGLPPSAVR